MRAASSRLDAIVAQATPRAGAERGVLRMSGPQLLERISELLPEGFPRPEGPPRRQVLQGRWEWTPGAALSAALWLMPAPASATGEDVAELHLAGSQPVLDCIMDAWLARGLRRADPGEFTRRAFLNGRLDLVQAEAVLDLIHARGAASARAAAAILGGALGKEMASAREALLSALVELEAGLDFEEGDSQDLMPGEIAAWLDQAGTALAHGRARETQRAARGRPQFRIALIGRPNAGKSSLFRALTGVEVLIAEEAGTTRDRLEAPWSGVSTNLPWILMDGPGLGGAAADSRDAAARARAESDEGEADMAWLCVDLSDPVATLPAPPAGIPHLIVLTKSELPVRASLAFATWTDAVAVSARTGAGFPALAARTASLCEVQAEATAARLSSADRHAAALQAAADAVARARALHERGGAADLVAEELREALDALAALAGALAPEEVLDRLFARFCVGK